MYFNIAKPISELNDFAKENGFYVKHLVDYNKDKLIIRLYRIGSRKYKYALESITDNLDWLVSDMYEYIKKQSNEQRQNNEQ